MKRRGRGRADAPKKSLQFYGSARFKKPHTTPHPGKKRGPCCYNCHELFHPGETCEGSHIICFHYLESGHKSIVCPKKKTSAASTAKTMVTPATKNDAGLGMLYDRSAITCYRCGEAGHKSFACPGENPKVIAVTSSIDAPRDDKEKKAFNYNCRKPIHLGKDCEGNPIVCFYCKEPGHKSYQCRKKKAAEASTTKATVSTAAMDGAAPRPKGRIFWMSRSEADANLDVVTGL